MASHVHKHESGWFSVKEVCEILDISRRTLYNWINDNKIDSKIEKKHRFVWLDLDGELQSKANGSSSYTDSHVKGANSHTDAQSRIQQFAAEQSNQLNLPLKMVFAIVFELNR